MVERTGPSRLLRAASSPSFNGANGIAVDPTNSATVYVAFFNNLIKTTDGGNTWTGVNTSPAGFFNIFTIVIDPVTPSTMYVGAGNGVFKSTDSGANWIVQNNFGVPSTPIVRTLAIDPTTPLTIYAGTNGQRSIQVDKWRRHLDRNEYWNDWSRCVERRLDSDRSSQSPNDLHRHQSSRHYF